MRSTLANLLTERQIFRTRDLLAAGVKEAHIAEAVADGTLVRPLSDTDEGPIYGMYATPEAMEHPNRDEAIAMVLTNGVFGRQYAAQRHNLATCMPPRPEIIVPATTQSIPTRVDYRLYRSRRPESLTVGIETVDVVAGIPIRFTNRARTTIDLLRARKVNSDDWRHGVEAATTFLEEGGMAAELMEMAGQFESWVPDAVETLLTGMSDSNARNFGR